MTAHKSTRASGQERTDETVTITERHIQLRDTLILAGHTPTEAARIVVEERL